MTNGERRAFYKLNSVCLALVVISHASYSIAAEISSALFPSIKYPEQPDQQNGSVSPDLIKLVQNLGRPCDKNESVSWKSSVPSKDLIKFSDRIAERLKASYTITDLLSVMKPVKGVDEMLGGLSQHGAVITLIWNNTPSTVNLHVCGNSLASKADRITMPGGEPVTPGKGPLDVKPIVIEK